MRRRSVAKLVASCILGVVLGFILITLPELLHGGYPGSLLVLVRNSVKALSIAHLLFLFVGGALCGLVFEFPYSLFASVSLVGSLPAFTLVGIMKDPTSHNLWPFELIIYMLLSIIPAGGMMLAEKIKRLFRAGRGPRTSHPSEHQR